MSQFREIRSSGETDRSLQIRPYQVVGVQQQINIMIHKLPKIMIALTLQHHN